MRTPVLAFLLALLPVGFTVLPQDPKPVAQETARPASPEVGKPAPVFRLNDHDGSAVAVGGKAEHWTVIAFYPKAATPG